MELNVFKSDHNTDFSLQPVVLPPGDSGSPIKTPISRNTIREALLAAGLPPREYVGISVATYEDMRTDAEGNIFLKVTVVDFNKPSFLSFRKRQPDA